MNQENRGPDLFDRIMTLPLLRLLEPFYQKHKEVLLYLLFGGLTTVVNFVCYAILTIPFGMHELVANGIAWVVAVTFAFVTNRIWVFASSQTSGVGIWKEAVLFYGGRVLTLLLEDGILLLFVTHMGLPNLPVKLVAQVLVILLNYVISKFAVFRKN